MFVNKIKGLDKLVQLRDTLPAGKVYPTKQSKLSNGWIPAGDPCPFIDKCLLTSTCERCMCEDNNQLNLTNDFSCATARGYDTIITGTTHPIK
jgi:hypothetical protein